MTDSRTVVHIDPVKADLPVEARLFSSAGVSFTARRCTSDDEVADVAAAADGILCLNYKLTASLLDRLARARVIVRYGVGVDNIDVDAATRRGIAVANVPDYCVDEVANHTMALLLALNRKLAQQNAALRAGGTVRLRPMGPLRGETLGLIGYGRLAQAVAERARPFGLRVVAFDPQVTAPAVQAEMLDLDDVLRQADYVSVHAPFNARTAGLIGEREIGLMKPTSYLISTARGGIVSERALCAALADGRIAGAGLDVWDTEPVPPSNPLLAHDNVVGTSHTAFYSDQALGRLRDRVVETALGVLNRTDYANVVNRAALGRAAG
jgi:D-3-phosphoglycerate dehydrogenase